MRVSAACESRCALNRTVPSPTGTLVMVGGDGAAAGSET